MEEKELRENWYFLYKDRTSVLIDERTWKLAFRLPIQRIAADLQRYAKGEER